MCVAYDYHRSGAKTPNFDDFLLHILASPFSSISGEILQMSLSLLLYVSLSVYTRSPLYTDYMMRVTG